jgi:hypothetical protein
MQGMTGRYRSSVVFIILFLAWWTVLGFSIGVHRGAAVFLLALSYVCAWCMTLLTIDFFLAKAPLSWWLYLPGVVTVRRVGLPSAVFRSAIVTPGIIVTLVAAWASNA